MKLCKIVVYVPESHADLIRETLARSGCGHIGNYDSCSFSVKGVGGFRPLHGAKPFLGSENILEKVVEERVETVCEESRVEFVLMAIKKVHPYEEPVIDVYQLL